MSESIAKPRKKRNQTDKPVIGSSVAKQLLYALRAMKHPYERAEVEQWEAWIRERVKGWRTAPLENLTLDQATRAALDSATRTADIRPQDDGRREWRHNFALEAIRAVSEAWVISEARPQPFTVELRRKSAAERALDEFLENLKP